MKQNSEYQTFNAAMATILRAEPVKVKAEVDSQIPASKAEREARGERKRGRKPSTRTATEKI